MRGYQSALGGAVVLGNVGWVRWLGPVDCGASASHRVIAHACIPRIRAACLYAPGLGRLHVRRRYYEPPRCAAVGQVCECSFAVLFSFTSRGLQPADLGGMLGLQLWDGGWAGSV